MSTIQTNSITDAAGTGAPDFPNGIEVSAGNVGIGTVSPDRPLKVEGSVDGRFTAAAFYNNINSTNTATSIELLDRNVVTGGTSAVRLSSNREAALNSFAFSVETASAGTYTERMRIDSSGNLLVGTTDASLYNNGAGGAVGVGLNPSGYLQAARSNSNPLLLNRLDSDGTIADFRKDGTVVGSIGSAGGAYLYVGSTDTADAYIRFYGDSSNPAVRPATSTGGNSDNAIDLGHTTARWDDIYAGNATIQTSDRNEKQDIEELNDAERRVAVACKGLMRKFRWISSVAEKGDDARIHFGIIAQDLQAAFAAEGLDAGRYAMFIHSTWTDEETGEERSRMGVRYTELLAFMIAVL